MLRTKRMMMTEPETRWKEVAGGSLRNTTLWIAIILVFLAFIPAALLVERQTMFEIIDGLCVGASVGVMVGYARAAWHAVKLPSHRLASADYLVCGVIMVAMFGAIRFGAQWAWRAQNKPDYWIDSAVLLIGTFGIVVGLFLILMTTSSKKGILLPAAYFRAGWLFTISLGIAALMIWAGWG
jgi:uncharacterized BrkB/YihY/UPF0761 family membrane protein